MCFLKKVYLVTITIIQNTFLTPRRSPPPVSRCSPSLVWLPLVCFLSLPSPALEVGELTLSVTLTCTNGELYDK